MFNINSIDHVAVPDPSATAQHIVAQAGGQRLSDHDMYVVQAEDL